MFSIIREHWRVMSASILKMFGLTFLGIESYEVIDNKDVPIAFLHFLVAGLVLGFFYFFIDGYLMSGFLKKEVKIPNTTIKIKFGDIFKQEGWKAVGVNDFFDSQVDENLVSSNSLHGFVINHYWNGKREDWQDHLMLHYRLARQVQKAGSKGIRYDTLSVQLAMQRLIGISFYS